MNDRPRGDELLAVARDALLGDVLPLLPAEKHHDILMIAKAMAIAARELEQGGPQRPALAEKIAAFYVLAGVDPCWAPNERSLARLIRERRIAPQYSGELYALLGTMTRIKLAISNPKYLNH